MPVITFSPRTDTDIARRNHIVRQNLGLAREIAHRWANQCAEPYEDLLQIAAIGLIKAVERFQSDRGVAFSSFAVPYIQGEIQHFLRDHDWDMIGVSRRRIEDASKVRRIKRKWQSLGREVDEAKIALSIGLTLDQWRAVQEETARKTVLSLDAASWVASPEPDSEAEEVRALTAALAMLPNPYRSVLTERFFGGLDIEAIANLHQASASQIEAWIKTGLIRLRSQLEGIC